MFRTNTANKISNNSFSLELSSVGRNRMVGGILFLVFITFFGCNKDFNKFPSVGSKPIVKAFSFEKKFNTFLAGTDTAIISGDSITIRLPFGTNISSLVPTVVHDAHWINIDSNKAMDFKISQHIVLKKFGYKLSPNGWVTDTAVTDYTVYVIIENGSANYAAINETKKYATAANGSDLQINIQASTIPTGSTRPLIIFTHGTGSSEQNALSMHSNTAALVAQGFIVANFNFYGSDNTKNNNDGKHLFDQYPMVVDYLIANASTYHINANAIILCGMSGSAAMAVHTAFKKVVFGCIVECGGMVTDYTWNMPSSVSKVISLAGIQTRSDNAFGGYFYTFADAESGASHNGSAYTENMGLRRYTGMLYDGDNQYCTAWGDAGLEATKNYLTTKYGSSFKSESSYLKVVEGSKAHCPGGTDWVNFMNTTPKKMLSDRGITW